MRDIQRELNISYELLNRVFPGINKKEYDILIRHLFTSLTNDSFLDSIPKGMINEERLVNLKKSIISLNINESECYKVLLTIPELLLFIDSFNRVYPVFKGKEFVGIIYADEKDYRAYSYSEDDFKYRIINSITKTRVNNDNNIVDLFLAYFNREDFRRDNSIEDREYNLNEKFDLLKEDYNDKDYYIRR